jgi:hypothetical protein
MVYGTTLLGGNLRANQVVARTRTDGDHDHRPSGAGQVADTVGWARPRTAAAGPAKNS